MTSSVAKRVLMRVDLPRPDSPGRWREGGMGEMSKNGLCRRGRGLTDDHDSEMRSLFSDDFVPLREGGRVREEDGKMEERRSRNDE